jgi:hypothetical protein
VETVTFDLLPGLLASLIAPAIVVLGMGLVSVVRRIHGKDRHAKN